MCMICSVFKAEWCVLCLLLSTRSFMICAPHHTTHVMKSRRMRWVGPVACMGRREVLGGNMKESHILSKGNKICYVFSTYLV